jgi:putative toxin-antitoxin system antitoxin component (TIGR02293 family)
MSIATKTIATFVPAVTAKTESRIGKTLGLKSMDASSLIDAAAAGLSWRAVKRFLDATGLTQQELANYLGIPERTFARRREAGAFDRRESEQLLRLAEIWEAALELFDGDAARTHSWLTSKRRLSLGGARPIDYANNEFGAREVRALIGRLEDGVIS